ncbi:MAG: RIP metalloprotease RseP [Chromatiales bacterium]|nr:RIP metalloprotease RseP [Chromatiales bacterium]
MPEFLTSLLAFIVAIGVLVAVHEYGHYIVARMYGIKVLRYSIGFGKVLWSRRSGPDNTEYCISAIPLGGYVKLLDERDCAVTLAERDRAFNRQPIPARIAVLFAGPGFNLAFAVLAYWLMFMVGVPGLKPMVGNIQADSTAEVAGLRDGDTITAVGGRPVATWEGAIIAMLDSMLGEGEIRLTLADQQGRERSAVLPTAGRESELTEPGQLLVRLGFEPYSPRVPPLIGDLSPGGSAERSGLRSGDLVLSADGEAVANWVEWVDYVRARPGETVPLTVLRDGRELSLDLDIDVLESAEGPIGRIGAGVLFPDDVLAAMRAEERYGLLAAVPQAALKTWEMTQLTVRMLWRMVTGDVSPRNISGPINIAQYAGQSATIGLPAFLSFLAIVSISLGILNLLPVPMLDGGQIVYSLAEAAKGSPLSERTQIIGQQVGILLLLLLMSFAFYNDLSRLFG